jgi:ketosteroid isomerase-like protein
MTTADDAVRARRKLTNRLIAEHQAARLRPFFCADATVIVGDGGVISGAEAIVGAFAGQFAEAGFGAYVRTTERVEIDTAGERAAERGAWVATRRDGAPAPSGTYLAVWRKLTGQWVIESELYVTLKVG